MESIKPIETYYNGYRFRSRLEARWAVFFDALGIEYEYEVEGYKNNDGIWYLPDFYLPEFRCLFEVKPSGAFVDGCFTSEWYENSDDGKKVNSIVESLKLNNDDKSFDYIIVASGSPYDCQISNRTDCGLVFNGIIGSIQYPQKEGDTPILIPITKKDDVPVWGHMPVVFEEMTAVYYNEKSSDESILFFGKKSYHDFEESDKKYEFVPIGLRCASILSLQFGVIPRYRKTALFNPDKLAYFALDAQDGDKSPIFSACIKSRQARFEHGETPRI